MFKIRHVGFAFCRFCAHDSKKVLIKTGTVEYLDAAATPHHSTSQVGETELIFSMKLLRMFIEWMEFGFYQFIFLGRFEFFSLSAKHLVFLKKCFAVFQKKGTEGKTGCSPTCLHIQFISFYCISRSGLQKFHWFFFLRFKQSL